MTIPSVLRKPIAIVGYRSGIDLYQEIANDLKLEIAGIFDRYFAGNTKELRGLPVLGSELDITEEDKRKYNFILGSGYAGHNIPGNQEHNGDRLRKKRIEVFKTLRLPTVSLISPYAYVNPTAKIGKSVVIGRDCYIRGYSMIGNFCYLDSGSAVAHDVILEDNVTLTPYSFIGGHIQVGSGTMVGANATVVNSYPDRDMRVGHDCKIMAGATVMKDVPDGKVVHHSGKQITRKD